MLGKELALPVNHLLLFTLEKVQASSLLEGLLGNCTVCENDSVLLFSRGERVLTCGATSCVLNDLFLIRNLGFFLNVGEVFFKLGC